MRKDGNNMKKIFSVLIFLSLILSLTSCSTIPSPQITEAEFPFEIVYEVDGETIKINDVYVCKFDGIGWNENTGKYRKWKGYVKSTGIDYLVLLDDGNLKFACKLGSAAYYMNDPSWMGAEKFTPEIYYIRTYDSGGVASGVTGIEPMLEEYKLRLISWSLSDPIKNYFH